jgi:hypothetical protein
MVRHNSKTQQNSGFDVRRRSPTLWATQTNSGYSLGILGVQKWPLGTSGFWAGEDAKMALTDVKCRGARPGKTRIKLSDGGGLQFWVQPTGSRLWQLVYQFQGKQAQMALGPYPQVSLIKARALREDAKAKIRAGRRTSISLRQSITLCIGITSLQIG